MPNIDIEQSKVTGYSTNISSGASSMQAKTLSPIDSESTIKGCTECQEAFAKSQQMLFNMVELINGEAEKIKSLGTQFTNVDDQLANMVKQISG